MERPRLYLDTNIFIYAFESKSERHQAAWRLLAATEHGRLPAFTSEMTLAELLVRPIRDGDATMVKVYEDLFSTAGPMTVVAVDRGILVAAATARAAVPALKLPDAIHLATANRCAITHSASFDKSIPLPPSMRHVAGDDTAAGFLGTSE